MLAERLGTFAAYMATGNPKLVRLVYYGSIVEQNTHLLRNAGLAGVLSRSVSARANLVNAMQIAAQRGWNVAERHESPLRAHRFDPLELETDCGVTIVEGAVLLASRG